MNKIIGPMLHQMDPPEWMTGETNKIYMMAEMISF